MVADALGGRPRGALVRPRGERARRGAPAPALVGARLEKALRTAATTPALLPYPATARRIFSRVAARGARRRGPALKPRRRAVRPGRRCSRMRADDEARATLETLLGGGAAGPVAAARTLLRRRRRRSDDRARATLGRRDAHFVTSRRDDAARRCATARARPGAAAALLTLALARSSRSLT